MIKSSCESILRRLKSNNAGRDQAIQELRVILEKGLGAIWENSFGSKVGREDVIQESLKRILENLHTFNGRCKFSTWAMTITVRTAFAEMRRRKFQGVSLNTIQQDHVIADTCSRSAAAEDCGSQKSNVLSGLQNYFETLLTEAEKEAISYLLAGVPVEVVASKTGSSRNAVYRLTHESRLRLRRAIKDEGTTANGMVSTIRSMSGQ